MVMETTEVRCKCSFSEELYGDFEDLETGDVHKGKPDPDTQVWLCSSASFDPVSKSYEVCFGPCRS